jgi:anthranilate/para-aminobenzoate synthase component I
VVADSDPEMELGETKAKAAALLPAVAGANPMAGMEDSVETPR